MQVTLIDLDLDVDYEFQVSGLNLIEGPKSEASLYRVAGFPDAPGAITEVPDSLTGSRIGLTWEVPVDDGGSAIVAYTLVQVIPNKPDVVLYFGLENQAVVRDLQSGVEYTFRVKTTTLVGDSLVWSDQYSFLIVDEPTPPINTALVSFDNTYVSLSWNQPRYNGGQALSDFKIYRQLCVLEDIGWELIQTLPAS